MALDQRHRYIISKVVHHAAVLCSTDAGQSTLWQADLTLFMQDAQG
jgi:hypothetical protein